MCGICGSTDAPTIGLLRAMCATIRHRGPDDEGVHLDREAGVGIAATRLSIIDLEHGHQPLANEDESVWAVLNGEIYNYERLRSDLAARGHRLSTASDTEVLVHLYEEHGPDFVGELEGMFALAVWDAKERTLVLARDRFGEKPLYYLEQDGVLNFASELTALSRVVGPLDLDPAALDGFFSFGYVPGASSIAAGVRRLEPAHRLVWRDGRAAVRRYWSLPAAEAGPAPEFEGLVDETERLLCESVRSRLVADVPVGVFLSGGVDSTLVAALAAAASGRSLASFSVTYDVGDVGEDIPARRMADAIGTEHHELRLTQATVEARAAVVLGSLDEPLADPSLFALHELARVARGTVKVAVGGEGADELFAGYPRYAWIGRGARIRAHTPAIVRRGADSAATVLERTSRLRVLHLAQMISSPPLVQRHAAWVTGGRLTRRAALYGPRLAAYAGSFPLDGIAPPLGDGPAAAGPVMDLDRRVWLPNDVLAKADRATMLASLEMRTPFLSRELAEFAAAIPPSVHLSHGGKALLRATLARTLPIAGSGRRKVAFRVPFSSWLRGPLAGALRAQLETSPLYENGWFERSTVEPLVRQHLSGDSDRSYVLWPLFVLGAWLDGAQHVSVT